MMFDRLTISFPLILAAALFAAGVEFAAAETSQTCQQKNFDCLDKCPPRGGFSGDLCRSLCHGKHDECLCSVDPHSCKGGSAAFDPGSPSPSPRLPLGKPAGSVLRR
jgi:hypothetical protein